MKPLNFEVTFKDEAINMLLELDDYATSAQSAVGGWCLMVGKTKAGGKGGKGKASSKAAAAPSMAKMPNIADMTDDMRTQLLAQLQQYNKKQGKKKV